MKKKDYIREKEKYIKDLGYIYKRQREESIYGENVISSPIAAEAILSIWKEPFNSI